MSRYCAIGRVVKSDHPKIKVGALMAVGLDKKWDDPYPMFLLYEAEDGTKLTYVELQWVEIKEFPKGLTTEEKEELMNIWLEQAIKKKQREPSLLKWINPEEVKK